MSDTLPEAFDRRSDNRDSARWVQDAIIGQTAEIDGLKGLIKEIAEHRHLCIPGGDAQRHLERHLVLEEEFKERQENVAIMKEAVRKLKVWAIMGIVTFLVGIMGYGLLVQLGMWEKKAEELTQPKATRERVVDESPSRRNPDGHFNR